MKPFVIMPAILITSIFLNAQQPVMISNPYPKTITVTGSAEMEVIPDEIYVEGGLR